MLKTLALTLAIAVTSPVLAQTRPPLVLTDIPEAAGPSVTLFNGRDLKDWDAWLGYADPALTYKRPPVAPLGVTAKSAEMFKVVIEDDRPALYVNGAVWGSLVHRGDFQNYHLRLQYKWGKG
ncbi:MAG: DUF1080 domain-containing protein, partial [Caulobacter sp.]